MATDNSNRWPVAKFHFVVKIDDMPDDEGGEGIECTEVTGLKFKAEFIEYRAGNDPTFTKLKVPGLKSYDPLTIKKAVFKSDNRFYEWFKDVQSGDDNSRKTIHIELRDEQHDVVITWTVNKAFPTSVSGPDLNSTANELAFETIELTHEGIEMILA